MVNREGSRRGRCFSRSIGRASLHTKLHHNARRRLYAHPAHCFCCSDFPKASALYSASVENREARNRGQRAALRFSSVSKPLMEKKRRARINKCLDQLKTLLESYYTSNIRKRKLEKADILELTVKHLRSLQKIQSCTSKSSGFSDYQAGFNSCLANVHQYLSMVDNVGGSDSVALSQLVSQRKSCAKGPQREASSTTDSDAGTQRLLRALNATDSANVADVGRFRATTKPHNNNNNNNNNNISTCVHYNALPIEVKAEEGHSFVLKQVLGIIPSKTQANQVLSVCHHSPRNGEASIHQSMWRPW
ncbi:hypothetical protein CRUP_032411 [Coryphaenoides rupestris]|nr:hypothetical protein CRUP_032411 [Coryphaenoides rupestris]